MAGLRLPPPRARSEGSDIRLRQSAKSRFHRRQPSGRAARWRASSGRVARQGAASGRVARQGAASGRVARLGAASGRVARLAQLQGAKLYGAQLQGASLTSAQLQGASLTDAQLQGAWLAGAQLQGALVAAAQLQGVSFSGATLKATDLRGAYLWRSNQADNPATLSAIRVSEDDKTWQPRWQDSKQQDRVWDDKAYEDLRTSLQSLPSGPLRDAALKRIEILDCSSPDKTLQSCDPAAAPPPEATGWRNAVMTARLALMPIAPRLRNP